MYNCFHICWVQFNGILLRNLISIIIVVFFFSFSLWYLWLILVSESCWPHKMSWEKLLTPCFPRVDEGFVLILPFLKELSKGMMRTKLMTTHSYVCSRACVGWVYDPRNLTLVESLKISQCNTSSSLRPFLIFYLNVNYTELNWMQDHTSLLLCHFWTQWII